MGVFFSIVKQSDEQSDEKIPYAIPVENQSPTQDQIKNITIKNQNFVDCKLKTINVITYINCNFVDCKLENAIFLNCSFVDCKLIKCTLKDCSFNDCTFTNCY